MTDNSLFNYGWVIIYILVTQFILNQNKDFKVTLYYKIVRPILTLRHCVYTKIIEEMSFIIK